MMRFSRCFCLLSFFAMSLPISKLMAAPEVPPAKVHTVSVASYYQPNSPTSAFSKNIIALMRRDPTIFVKKWGGISLPSAGQSSLMMSLAGGTAPDISVSYFHTIHNDISQNFLYPLNEWIGEDTNGNGVIDDHEVKWEQWKTYRPLWKRIATRDGKIYGIPVPVKNMHAVLFRIDLVKAAGLDPNNPPEDWDQLYEWCKKLTNPGRQVKGAAIQMGQRGIVLPQSAYMLLPWIQAAGGKPIIQIRKSPKTGRSFTFDIDEEKFITPEGEDLSREASDWRANWDTPEGHAALDFWYKLRWEKWSNGTEEIEGVARVNYSRPGETQNELLSNGEAAMQICSIEDLASTSNSLRIDPDLLSWFPIPAAPGPKGKKVVQIFQHYVAMYANVADRSKEERDAVWEVLKVLTSPAIIDDTVRERALSGMGRFVQPAELKRLGFDEYLRDIPAGIARNFEEIESGAITAKTEPFTGYWLVINSAMQRRVLSVMLGANGRTFDYHKAFSLLQQQANKGMMYEVSEEYLAARRWPARAIATLIVAMIFCLLWKIVVSYRQQAKIKASNKSVYSGWFPVLLLVPALLIISIWKYYPLLRGMVMAVQDYKIVGESKFIGLKNFIILCTDQSFWMSLLRTVYYVVLNMCLAFIAPIILAIMLTEVPRGKIFYRTLFFLPHMTSGIVIALMWKLMYNPTPAGFFNQLIGYLNKLPGINIANQTWLEDPAIAMVCCIIPSVWAGMGMASLIYLAALQSLPKELYEAAEMDGAEFMAKLRHITLPYLLPLIVINFVGTFIGTFQGMGNIFLLTFGGPGESTMVIGLKIWQEAYINLRFSMATSMAWILGSGLIGLTYIQIQFLQRVEFKKANEN